MKFFSMKKPAVRILLLVVLLGLAIFYFRYMREGFAGKTFLVPPSGVTTPTMKVAATATTGSKVLGTTQDLPTNLIGATATTGSKVLGTTRDILIGATDPTTGVLAAPGASSGTFTEGSSCVVIGSAGKTIKGKTLYCCDSRWSKNTCTTPTPLPKDEAG